MNYAIEGNYPVGASVPQKKRSREIVGVSEIRIASRIRVSSSGAWIPDGQL